MCGQHAGDVVLVAEAVALRHVDEALPAAGGQGGFSPGSRQAGPASMLCSRASAAEQRSLSEHKLCNSGSRSMTRAQMQLRACQGITRACCAVACCLEEGGLTSAGRAQPCKGKPVNTTHRLNSASMADSLTTSSA